MKKQPKSLWAKDNPKPKNKLSLQNKRLFLKGLTLLCVTFICNYGVMALLLIDNYHQQKEMDQLEVKFKYEKYSKDMKHIQYEQLKTCVIEETRLRQIYSNMSLSLDCYRYGVE